MAYGRVLVTASSDDRRATLLVDLDSGNFDVLFPYIGGICVVDDRLYIARLEDDRTRIEAYDRRGLAWARRVRDCVDTHSLCATREGLAVCSTGTNEVIRLDHDGVEIGRWSPDDAAEGDSWHVNSLASRGGRLFVTCFGRFDRFRGWAGRIEGSGLLLEVGSGRVVLNGFSAPHDPRPVEGGWFVNDAKRSATLFCPESGPRRVVFEMPGFARGMEVFDDFLVVGSSSHRLNRRPTTGSFLFVIDRETGGLREVIPLPYDEVGHIVAVPPDEVLEAARTDAMLGLSGLAPQIGPIPEADRAGSIEVVGPVREVNGDREQAGVLVRVSNRSNRVWSSHDEPSLRLACLLRDGEGSFQAGVRTLLPIPILPGRDLTFEARVDFLDEGREPPVGEVEVTMLQEGVAWWHPSDLWTPAVLKRGTMPLGVGPA